MSLDPEVASDRQILHLSSEKLTARQLMFARLDTRDVCSLSPPGNLRSLISPCVFEIKVLPKSKKEKRPCIFAQTQYRTQDEVPTIISQSLLIRDIPKRPETSYLRNIDLVGHSTRKDLKILHFLDVNIPGIAPILTILETHTQYPDLFAPLSSKSYSKPTRKLFLSRRVSSTWLLATPIRVP